MLKHRSLSIFSRRMPPRVCGARLAFSAVELLVVIAILGVLLALLFPMFGRVRASAKIVTCQSNIRQIMLLMRMYSQSNDGRLPPQAIGLDDWSGSLLRVAQGRPVFVCPEDDSPRRDILEATSIRSYGVNNGPF